MLAPLLGPEVGVTHYGCNMLDEASKQIPRASNLLALGGQMGFSQASSVGAGVWNTAGDRNVGTQAGCGAQTSAEIRDIKDCVWSWWLLVHISAELSRPRGVKEQIRALQEERELGKLLGEKSHKPQ